MWQRRLEDKERAEGIADRDYAMLQVERGLVVSATRNYQPPTLEKILRHWGLDPEHDMRIGSGQPGWGAFIRAKLRKQNQTKIARIQVAVEASRRNTLQRKKMGRGWLHS
jgi:hypothetical protein